MVPSPEIARAPPVSNTAWTHLTDVSRSSLSGLNGMGTPVHHMNRFRFPDRRFSCLGP